MNKKQVIVVAGIVLLLAALAVVLGILLRKDPDVDPTPLPESNTPDAGLFVLEASIEDAGEDGGDSAPSGKHPGKTDPRITKLIACCRVVANNAQSVGDPMTRASMIQAASVCEASAKSGQLAAVERILDQYDVPCD